MKTSAIRRVSVSILLAASTLAAAACSPIVRTNGNMIEDSRLEQLQPGVSTRADVATVFGSPTTVSTFEDDVWYYIGQRQQQRAFFRPEITERRVVVVSFNDNDVVQSVNLLGLEDGQEVEIVQRETPTLGRQMTFLEQMLGNLGRFNVPDGGRRPGSPI